jgi:hypothetical protein
MRALLELILTGSSMEMENTRKGLEVEWRGDGGCAVGFAVGFVGALHHLCFIWNDASFTLYIPMLSVPPNATYSSAHVSY